MAPRHRKNELLELVTQAIRDDGWNILFLSDPEFHPFRLNIYKGEMSYNVRIYIWNLTHGGGAARPAHEYRIQITGVDHFERETGGKALILGWWKEGEVFAGFDFQKHTGTLGFSPSIQIREEALRKAHINGISPWTKENQEVAIAFRSDFLVEYIRNLESLHSFGQSTEDLEILTEMTDDPNAVNDALISSVSVERQVTVANIKRKIRDNSFKSRVLTSYTHKCAFCGVQLKLVEAAHIVPVQHDGSDETSNGIALCVLHHKAYDRNLVTFTEDYRIAFSEPEIDKLKNLHLDGGVEQFINGLRPMIHLPPNISDRPHVDNIRMANRIRGWE